MKSMLDEQVIPMVSPLAERVIKRLMSEPSFGKAAKIWDLAVREWRFEGKEVSGVFRLMIDEMVEADKSWVDYRADVMSLLASYNEFKTGESVVDEGCMQRLVRSELDSFSLVRIIAGLEASKRRVGDDKLNHGSQRT